MKNLFATDFIKNIKTGEESNDIERVMRWLASGEPVEFELMDLESYFQYGCVTRDLKEIVEKDGQLFLRQEFQWEDDFEEQDTITRFDYPFFGFTKDVRAVMYHNWVIHEASDEELAGKGKAELLVERDKYIRNLNVAKEWLAAGKKLVCDIYSLAEMSQTAQIIEIKEMYGVPYIVTATGKKYILEPQYRLFQCADIMLWPEAVTIRNRNE